MRIVNIKLDFDVVSISRDCEGRHLLIIRTPEQIDSSLDYPITRLEKIHIDTQIVSE